MNKFRELFQNDVFDHFIFLIIILNSIVLFLQESGMQSFILNIIDAICIIIFVIEMCGKLYALGVHDYWKDGWNKFDGTLVIISIPSLVYYFFPNISFDLSILLLFRVLRVLRFSRIIHLFPQFSNIMKSLWKALKNSVPIFIVFFILILIFALFSCALFKESSPQYFGTPWDAIYSTFRLCTLEGWYDIPDSLSIDLSSAQIAWIRIYFIIILVFGGIIGLSLVNSIFVDAMVSDNSEKLEQDVKALQNKIDILTEEIKSLRDK